MKYLAIIFISSGATFFWGQVVFCWPLLYLGFAFPLLFLYIYFLLEPVLVQFWLFASGGGEFFLAQLFPSSCLRDKQVPANVAHLCDFLFSPTSFAFQNQVALRKLCWQPMHPWFHCCKDRIQILYLRVCPSHLGSIHCWLVLKSIAMTPSLCFLPWPHLISIALGSWSAYCLFRVGVPNPWAGTSSVGC